MYVSGQQGSLNDAERAVVAALTGAGISLTWSLMSKEVIEATGPLILASDAVLALVGHLGTYHLGEIRFALGHASWKGDGRPLSGRPLPVFAYAEDVADFDRNAVLASQPGIVALPMDPDAAAAEIVAKLGARPT
jgi:hypothetical protein